MKIGVENGGPIGLAAASTLTLHGLVYQLLRPVRIEGVNVLSFVGRAMLVDSCCRCRTDAAWCPSDSRARCYTLHRLVSLVMKSVVRVLGKAGDGVGPIGTYLRQRGVFLERSWDAMWLACMHLR